MKNKNQHFVPQAYLRSFAESDDRKSIALFNLNRSTVATGASIRGQCSKPYFYGHQAEIEQGFASIESKYGLVRQKIENGQSLEDQDHDIRIFLMIQLFRTPRMIERLYELEGEFTNGLFAKRNLPQKFDTEIEKIMNLSVLIGIDSIPLTRHLKSCFLKAPNHADFFTSDNPVSFLNKFHLQSLKTREFGYGNAGAMFFLPVTPRICLLLYDGAAYTVPRTNGSPYVTIRTSDVHAINSLTMIYAHRNLYGPTLDEEHLRGLFDTLKVHREEVGYTTKVVNTTRPGPASRRGERGQESTNEVFVAASQKHPDFVPTLRFLRMRSDFKPFDSKSAAGIFSSIEAFRTVLSRH